MRLYTHRKHPQREHIEQAVEALQRGKLIVLPTDTLYGLGADATNPEAVRSVALTKGRMPGEPLPLLVSNKEMALKFADRWPEEAHILATRFWPGALTLILPAKPELSLEIIGPSGGVGLRMPDSPVALRIIQELGRPVVGTSANFSGEPGALDPDEIDKDIGYDIEILLDVGKLAYSPGSTVVDLTKSVPKVLRHGAVDTDLIADALSGVLNGAV